MKTIIVDKEALSSIAPIEFSNYLGSKGATKIGEYQSKANVWDYLGRDIIIPHLSTFADYPNLMAQAIQQIEEIENRPQLSILNDIKDISYDVIRIRNVSSDTKQGTLNLVDSVSFVGNTKDLILAAACSAATHKLTYQNRKPQLAEQFMRSVRFGRTEQGSFIITLLSPVVPELKLPNQACLVGLVNEVPYEKRVIPTLESGLRATLFAAQKTSEDEEVQHFIDGAKDGITTNLCDAISGLHDELKPDYIELNITYSGNRKGIYKRPTIKIGKDYIPILKEVSAQIKSIEPEPEQTVRGMIVSLGSEQPKQYGEISIKDIYSKKPRTIIISLSSEEYSKAIKAHSENDLVEISGTLKKINNCYKLDDVSTLKII